MSVEGTAGSSIRTIRIAGPEDLVTIAFRRRAVHSARQLGAVIVLLGAAAAIYGRDWAPAAGGLAIAWLVWLLLSYRSANKVERTTGLTHRDQARVWERYKSEPAFADTIEQALRDGRLRSAIRELTRPFDADVGARRTSGQLHAVAAALAGSLMLVLAVDPADAQQRTLRFIPQADLRILDPITTTAYITRNHGYMVYDTLFATDEHFQIQPQMVDKWDVSADKLTYTFTLREGLKFHDGQPVRSADAIASIERWSKRDGLGQKLAEAADGWTAVNDKTFRLKLKKPFPLVLESLGKLSSNVPFIMPERVARTDPFQNITDPTGSGPFRMVKEEWVPGNKVVYVRNAEYMPRKEAPSWAAGAKLVKVDRVEWVYIPDSATAAAAMNAGEADWWEQLPPDLAPLLARNKALKVENIDPLGSIGVLRFNFLQPPFNNPKMRAALTYVVNQPEYLVGLAGDVKNGKPCYSYFTCGTPLSTEAGAEALTGRRDFEKAKALIHEAGYKGEKIVIITATDQPIVHSQSLITAELLRKLGLNVDLQAGDWGTLVTRRTSKEPVDKGGWSIFHTWLVGPDLVNPGVNFAVRGNGDKAWFGWPSDSRLEALRDEWFAARDAAAQKKAAEEVQREAFAFLPYIPTAQFIIPTAYRTSLTGVMVAPVTFLWNVEKK